jgi:hypothetical protein
MLPFLFCSTKETSEKLAKKNNLNQGQYAIIGSLVEIHISQYFKI